MRRFLWIALGLGIGLVTMSGCKKAAPTTMVPATTNQPTTSSTTQGSGQTATPSGTTSGQTAAAPQPADPERPLATNPAEGDRKAPFAVWWNGLSPAEREAFNKLPPEERSKKLREVLGK